MDETRYEYICHLFKSGADIIYKSSYKATLELNKVIFFTMQPDEHQKYQINKLIKN